MLLNNRFVMLNLKCRLLSLFALLCRFMSLFVALNDLSNISYSMAAYLKPIIARQNMGGVSPQEYHQKSWNGGKMGTSWVLFFNQFFLYL